jgi:hypothetical protein
MVHRLLLSVRTYFIGERFNDPAWEIWMTLTFSGLLALIAAGAFHMGPHRFHP